jgi:hypothetical protein
MTRKLEELFDLPPSLPVEPVFTPDPPQISTQTLDAIDKIGLFLRIQS